MQQILYREQCAMNPVLCSVWVNARNSPLLLHLYYIFFHLSLHSSPYRNTLRYPISEIITIYAYFLRAFIAQYFWDWIVLGRIAANDYFYQNLVHEKKILSWFPFHLVEENDVPHDPIFTRHSCSIPKWNVKSSTLHLSYCRMTEGKRINKRFWKLFLNRS